MLHPAPDFALDSVHDLDATFLPTGHMRQISRVSLVDDQRIEGEVTLGISHWVYPEHFPTDPIFPGSLMVEAAGQLVALWAWAHGHRGRPRLLRTAAEFHHPVHPATARLELRADIRAKRHLQFGSTAVYAGVLQVATIECVLGVLPAE